MYVAPRDNPQRRPPLLRYRRPGTAVCRADKYRRRTSRRRWRFHPPAPRRAYTTFRRSANHRWPHNLPDRSVCQPGIREPRGRPFGRPVRRGRCRPGYPRRRRQPPCPWSRRPLHRPCRPRRRDRPRSRCRWARRPRQRPYAGPSCTPEPGHTATTRPSKPNFASLNCRESSTNRRANRLLVPGSWANCRERGNSGKNVHLYVGSDPDAPCSLPLFRHICLHNTHGIGHGIGLSHAFIADRHGCSGRSRSRRRRPPWPCSGCR